MGGAFLLVMCGLHYYWFTLFMGIIYRALTTGELKDTIQDVDATVVKDKKRTGEDKAASDGKPTTGRRGGKAEKLE